MAEQEEKRVIVKVAYNYFQSSKWDRALDEYKKLLTIDPMDFLVYNMMAECYIRKGEKGHAISEFLKAASLLRATNNFEKAIHAYNHVLKLDPENDEARTKIEESVRTRLVEADEMVRRGSLKNAAEICDRLLNKLPDHPLVNEKIAEIERLQKEKEENQAAASKTPAPEPVPPSVPVSKDDAVNKEDVIKNLFAMADRYEQKQSWDEAVEAYITILRFLPEDDQARNKLRQLYRKITQQDKAAEVWSRIKSEKKVRLEEIKERAKTMAESESESELEPEPGPVQPAIPAVPQGVELDPRKTELGTTVNELEKLRIQAEEKLRRAVEDRRERERQRFVLGAAPQPSAPVSPAEERAEQDNRVLLTQAQMYVHQNMLVEAMRLCQKILETDSQNREVRGLLKQIYDKKNL
jgi:tetratricopeptide (TPR) repeat protein